jgi:hypothetical protein
MRMLVSICLETHQHTDWPYYRNHIVRLTLLNRMILNSSASMLKWTKIVLQYT